MLSDEREVDSEERGHRDSEFVAILINLAVRLSAAVGSDKHGPTSREDPRPAATHPREWGNADRFLGPIVEISAHGVDSQRKHLGTRREYAVSGAVGLDHRTDEMRFTRKLLEDFYRLLPDRADSDRSWTVERADIEAKNYDLKAVNPNAKSNEDTRTPEELLDLIEAKGREVAEALTELRALSQSER